MGTVYGGESRMSLLIINFLHHPLIAIIKKKIIGLNETQTIQNITFLLTNDLQIYKGLVENVR